MQEEMINCLSAPPTKNAPIRVRTLKGLLNCNISLIFTFLWATNQAKALTLEETFEFYKKLAGWKGIEFEALAKAEKKN